MLAFLVRRLLITIAVLFGLLTLTFALVHVLPGDPARLTAGPGADARTVDTIRRELGLDQPLGTQYLRYLGDVVRGDLGRSYQSRRPVRSELAEVYPKTVVLALTAEAFAAVLGVGLGVAAATSGSRALDRLILAFAALNLSFPLFWLALMLQLSLSVFVRALPPSGYDLGLDRFVILPALTLALPSSGFLARITRSSLMELRQAAFLRMARAKGVSEPMVVLRHALPNALIPILTTIGLDLARLLGGIVIVETIFAWPGVGKYAFDALAYKDLPALQASILVFAVSVSLVNLMVDVLYASCDPRLR